ncbi:hypothetical protein QYE76_014801 [Lolium multiflorum]|uniref:NAC domain-containing protein n=1 Tax=Lolium multiflorum TaxID=4521 RepID=A0AAD8X907_LOLMU|nr:hypothetical protein QYE76_014801 [Lolium multiflorum]
MRPPGRDLRFTPTRAPPWMLHGDDLTRPSLAAIVRIPGDHHPQPPSAARSTTTAARTGGSGSKRRARRGTWQRRDEIVPEVALGRDPRGSGRPGLVTAQQALTQSRVSNPPVFYAGAAPPGGSTKIQPLALSTALMASPPPFPTPERVPGLSFAPQDDELITRYLGPKIARQPLPAATADFIHETDVYAADPAALCAAFPPSYSGIEESSKIWYFFTSPKAKNSRGSRKSRTVGENQGTWHSESRKDVCAGKEKDRLVGYRRSFSHETSSGEKSGWLMMEFGVGANQEDGPVVCKIYKTPRPASAGCSARKKKKATDPAATSARVRRRLNFRSPTATPDDDFLNETQRQQTEAEELAPAFDPISFLADGHALSALNCYDTPVQGDWPTAPENSGSWTTADPLLPVETRPEESASAGDCSFFFNDHAGFELSCPGTAHIAPGAYWPSPVVSQQYVEPSAVDCSFFSNNHAGFTPSRPDTTLLSPAASRQYGKISYGSCPSLAVTGFQHDASFYWPLDPSSAPAASAAAATPLRSCGTNWASPMLLPLQGWRNSLC